jgi:hypothetical protein
MKLYIDDHDGDIYNIHIPTTIQEASNYKLNIKNNIEYFALDIFKK